MAVPSVTTINAHDNHMVALPGFEHAGKMVVPLTTGVVSWIKPRLSRTLEPIVYFPAPITASIHARDQCKRP
jgi:hypothetical protein